MAAIEVWLHGGPADGRLQLVELVLEELPEVVQLLQPGVFVGSAHEAQRPVEYIYRRARDRDTDDYPVYRHDADLPADR